MMIWNDAYTAPAMRKAGWRIYDRHVMCGPKYSCKSMQDTHLSEWVIQLALQNSDVAPRLTPAQLEGELCGITQKARHGHILQTIIQCPAGS
eukprot:12407719-Karenia_brevis.AAC.1